MKNVYEILEEVEKASSKSDKINVLRQNSTYALKSVLKGAFDPRVEFTFTEIPEYKPDDAPPGLGYSTIHQELSRMYLFEKNNPKVPPTLSEQRKKEILIQILESLEEKEAKVLANMLMKKVDAKGVNYKLVKEAFPDILP